jgi:hypothetical protein
MDRTVAAVRDKAGDYKGQFEAQAGAGKDSIQRFAPLRRLAAQQQTAARQLARSTQLSPIGL